MSLIMADRVKETSTTTGTGTLSLGGTSTGYQTFVTGIGSGNTCPYLIDDGNGNWEVTWGLVTSGTPATITRGTLISSSTGSRISFVAGTKTVTVVPAAELLLWPANCAALVETSIASATTTDLSTVQTFRALVTGTTTITGLGTQPNMIRWIRFASSLTLTYNATTLITPNKANIQTGPDDVCMAISDASGNVTIVNYQPAGAPVLASCSAQSLTGSLAQKATWSLSAGTWEVSATLYENGGAGAVSSDTVCIGTTTASSAGTTPGKDFVNYAVDGNGRGGGAISPYIVTLAATTTYYLNANSNSGTTPSFSASVRCKRVIA